MTESIPDVGVIETMKPQAEQNQRTAAPVDVPEWLTSKYVVAVARPRARHRRNSADFSVVDTAPFLKACSLCKRRLGPGRDIFMYRGEMAFCSLECRQQRMNYNERKEKCSLSSMKKDTPSVSTGNDSSSSGETVAAA
ncbi:FCS-Like Zinc finger 6-like [Dioscorea cayenensis subsp. rotundata]|uniref:FCS-Like Zinc finger 6-like n=1 Tax=Dioscorea cayennensis subsp. rotundata TaxID=55577 RepID=A0AB40B7L7_DIOCR|nr:FCS-Like Zinc finger 6-like [Dioscorea cayenensis subsp. rotundata]